MVPIVDVTVIIVNWNGGQLLGRCVESLHNQTLQPKAIMVVDNGSDDESARLLADDGRIQLHLMGENLGFAEANNRALQLCTTEYVALLNPDAFAENTWLQELVKAAQSHPDCASFASLQVQHENASLIDGMGDVYHASGLAWRRGYGTALAKQTAVTGRLFSACAGAALYRRSALQAVGGFDSDYFCYFEDVDLGFRLRLLGWGCRYVPTARVEHVGSALTGGRRSSFAVYHGHRNAVWTFAKNMPTTLLIVLLPLHLAMNLFVILLFVARGQGRSIWRSKRDALKGLPAIWVKRKQLQRQRKLTLWQLALLLTWKVKK